MTAQRQDLVELSVRYVRISSLAKRTLPLLLDAAGHPDIARILRKAPRAWDVASADDLGRSIRQAMRVLRQRGEQLLRGHLIDLNSAIAFAVVRSCDADELLDAVVDDLILPAADAA